MKNNSLDNSIDNTNNISMNNDLDVNATLDHQAHHTFITDEKSNLDIKFLEKDVNNSYDLK